MRFVWHAFLRDCSKFAQPLTAFLLADRFGERRLEPTGVAPDIVDRCHDAFFQLAFQLTNRQPHSLPTLRAAQQI
jgi:hypothetical protein